jgi:hypothetical protein
MLKRDTARVVTRRAEKQADRIGRIRAWTYHRQRLGRAASRLAEAPRDVVGV